MTAPDEPADGSGPDGAGGDRPSRPADSPDGVTIRRATPDDLAAVLRAIEGALLAVDADRVRRRIAAGEALVAVGAGGTVVGALVRDGERVLAVAVVRRRRRQGIGRALVERALGRAGRLTATFDPRVRGFYEALGFSIRSRPPCRGAGDGDGGGAPTGDAAVPRAAADPAGRGHGDAGDGNDGRDGDPRLWGVRTG
ncbi:MAG: GNAT family N-acetyltransferase [Haloferacaceae archaeon]